MGIENDSLMGGLLLLKVCKSCLNFVNFIENYLAAILSLTFIFMTSSNEIKKNWNIFSCMVSIDWYLYNNSGTQWYTLV